MMRHSLCNKNKFLNEAPGRNLKVSIVMKYAQGITYFVLAYKLKMNTLVVLQTRKIQIKMFCLFLCDMDVLYALTVIL